MTFLCSIQSLSFIRLYDWLNLTPIRAYEENCHRSIQPIRTLAYFPFGHKMPHSSWSIRILIIIVERVHESVSPRCVLRCQSSNLVLFLNLCGPLFRPMWKRCHSSTVHIYTGSDNYPSPFDHLTPYSFLLSIDSYNLSNGLYDVSKRWSDHGSRALSKEIRVIGWIVSRCPQDLSKEICNVMNGLRVGVPMFVTNCRSSDSVLRLLTAFA